jgi:positive regulator of sigma E activity
MVAQDDNHPNLLGRSIMNIQRGMVEKTDAGWAWVKTRSTGPCGQCGCGQYFQAAKGADRVVVKARNAVHAQQGDEVELCLNAKTRFKGLFVLYLFPVLGLVTGAFSAKSLSGFFGLSANLGLAVFTLSGFVLAMLGMRLVSRRMEAKGELTPSVSRVVRPSAQVGPAIAVQRPGCACSL